MRKILLAAILISAVLFVSCQKKTEEVTTEQVVKNSISVEAVGYGDTENSAISNAQQEAEFKAFGKVVSKDGQLEVSSDGKCKEYTVIEKSQDDVGMWIIKIKAVVEQI